MTWGIDMKFEFDLSDDLNIDLDSKLSRNKIDMYNVEDELPVDIGKLIRIVVYTMLHFQILKISMVIAHRLLNICLKLWQGRIRPPIRCSILSTMTLITCQGNIINKFTREEVKHGWKY